MKKQKRQFLITNEIGQFWTGSGWSDEYPDAELFSSKAEASRASIKALFKAVCVSVEEAS